MSATGHGGARRRRSGPGADGHRAPYRFVSHAEDEDFVFERFEDHFLPVDHSREVPHYAHNKHLTVLVRPEVQSRLAGLEVGEIDTVQELGPDNVKPFVDDPDFTVQFQPADGWTIQVRLSQPVPRDDGRRQPDPVPGHPRPPGREPRDQPPIHHRQPPARPGRVSTVRVHRRQWLPDPGAEAGSPVRLRPRAGEAAAGGGGLCGRLRHPPLLDARARRHVRGGPGAGRDAGSDRGRHPDGSPVDPRRRVLHRRLHPAAAPTLCLACSGSSPTTSPTSDRCGSAAPGPAAFTPSRIPWIRACTSCSSRRRSNKIPIGAWK